MKLGFIGSGRMTTQHALAAKSLGVEIMGVVGKTETPSYRTLGFQREFGCPIFQDVVALLDAKPDGLVVAVPMFDLYKVVYLIVSFNETIPILVEKPFFTNTYQYASNHQMGNVYIAYNRRFYMNIYAALLDVLRRKEMRVAEIDARIVLPASKLNSDPTEIGSLHHELLYRGTHLIDLLFLIADLIKFRTGETEFTWAIEKMKGGYVPKYNVSRSRFNSSFIFNDKVVPVFLTVATNTMEYWCIRILFHDGSIFEIMPLERSTYYHDFIHLNSDKGKVIIDSDTVTHGTNFPFKIKPGIRFQMSEFISLITTGEQSLFCNVGDGIRVITIVEKLMGLFTNKKEKGYV